MRKTTDIESIKEIAINFLYITPTSVKDFPIFVNHPFFENRVMILPETNEMFDIFENKEKYNKLLTFFKEKISVTNSLRQIFFLIRKSYRCTFFKYANKYMNITDFSEMLIYCWSSCELPSTDVNVSQKEFLKWFSKGDKYSMMDNEDFALYNNLQNEIKIYRGCKLKESEIQFGISWTTDENQAIWFSKRYNDNGYVYSAIVEKENILCYTNQRNEHEIIINPLYLSDIKLINN